MARYGRDILWNFEIEDFKKIITCSLFNYKETFPEDDHKSIIIDPETSGGW